MARWHSCLGPSARQRIKLQKNRIGLDGVRRAIDVSEPEVGAEVDELETMMFHVLKELGASEDLTSVMKQHVWERIVETVALALQAGHRIPRTRIPFVPPPAPENP